MNIESYLKKITVRRELDPIKKETLYDNKTFSAVTAIALVGFISTTPAFAQDKGATDQSQHEGHHPDASTPPPASTKPMGEKDMMGKMDMSQMQGMMHDCMEMHKDSKMCDHNMMEKCQKDMG